MWPRAVEIMLGIWLWMIPFIFLREPGPPAVWVNAFVCGTLLITFAASSFWGRARRAHLLGLPLAGWLIVYGYVKAGHPSEPVHQGFMITGLVLVLFAFIPSEAGQPPLSWRKYYEERAKSP